MAAINRTLSIRMRPVCSSDFIQSPYSPSTQSLWSGSPLYSFRKSAIASNDGNNRCSRMQPSCLVESHSMPCSPLHRVQVTMVWIYCYIKVFQRSDQVGYWQVLHMSWQTSNVERCADWALLQWVSIIVTDGCSCLEYPVSILLNPTCSTRLPGTLFSVPSLTHTVGLMDAMCESLQDTCGTLSLTSSKHACFFAMGKSCLTSRLLP